MHLCNPPFLDAFTITRSLWTSVEADNPFSSPSPTCSTTCITGAGVSSPALLPNFCALAAEAHSAQWVETRAGHAPGHAQCSPTAGALAYTCTPVRVCLDVGTHAGVVIHSKCSRAQEWSSEDRALGAVNPPVMSK
eukprot:scaffold113297_cov23-Tisochrysis_lutea.AAC.1